MFSPPIRHVLFIHPGHALCNGCLQFNIDLVAYAMKKTFLFWKICHSPLELFKLLVDAQAWSLFMHASLLKLKRARIVIQRDRH
jgi:hypothetical protein